MPYKIMQFWRNSLTDMDSLSASQNDFKSGVCLSLKALEKGFINPKEVASLFLDAEKKRKKKGNKLETISVLISPFTANNRYQHGVEKALKVSKQQVYPLFLKAKITLDGTLIPDEKSPLPWLNRNCISPNDSKQTYPIIADVKEVDEFYTTKKDGLLEHSGNWQGYFQEVIHFFHCMVGKNPVDVFATHHFSLESEGHMCLLDAISKPSQHIINTYDQYHEGSGSSAKLLTAFCQIDGKEKASNMSKESLFSYSAKHYGQIQKNFPLSASQRTALHYFFDDIDNDVFTVNGPPGTGKTTLINSVIASMWVERAIEGTMPPIIVASSAANLAIINILDGLKATAFKRWLPKIESFGLYLCSSDNVEFSEKNKHLYKLKQKESGSINAFYQIEYHTHAVEHFINECNAHYQRSFEHVDDCIELLHNSLVEKANLLEKVVQFSLKYDSDEKAFLEAENSIEKLKQKRANIMRLRVACLDDSATLSTLNTTWLRYKIDNIGYLASFSWLPFVRRKLMDKIRLFASHQPSILVEEVKTVDCVNEQISELISNSNARLHGIENELKEIDRLIYHYETRQVQKHELELLSGIRLGELFDYANSKAVLSQLDTTIRHDLFILATHYWEGRWLEESYKHQGRTLKHNLAGRTEYWQIHAMLTPCFITTLFSGPSFFEYRTPAQAFNTMSDVIDLLIIDEAGQVMPCIAGGMISVAKRVLLVGDAKQIQPVFSLLEGIDFANAKKFHLCEHAEEYEAYKTNGFLCSGDQSTGDAYGNLIVFGQRHAKYHLSENKEPGMLLLEHRRCATEIISYCNELCYDNQLLIHTNEVPCEFPKMGYAHVKGKSYSQGESLCNEDEATIMVQWIIDNKTKILKAFGKEELTDCIGIVTPFKAQAMLIAETLNQHHIVLDKVGTTHALQGAEKPMILFSSVYVDDNVNKTFFFDRSPNLLNVAVSRAKQSFLVFGDMDIFELNIPGRPSSLLASYLFSKASNELTNINQPKKKQFSEKDITSVTTLEMHRKVLKRSFEAARELLCIVSPFLTKNALNSDDVLIRIREASSRIKIKIFTDPALNQNINNTHFNELVQNLEKAGAQVLLVSKVHSKLIVVDNRVLVLGSFNWLSSSRALDRCMAESSLIYKGEQVSSLIDKTLVPIEKKVILLGMGISNREGAC